MPGWAAVLVIISIGVVVAAFFSWFWFVYIPRSAIQDYEPDAGSDETITGELLMSLSFKSGGAKTQKALYYFIEHLYWLVRDQQTGFKVAVLVNGKKKQFRGAEMKHQTGDVVRVTGKYLKRRFDNEAAMKILDAADQVTVNVQEKKTRSDLRFLGITIPYNSL